MVFKYSRTNDLSSFRGDQSVSTFGLTNQVAKTFGASPKKRNLLSVRPTLGPQGMDLASQTVLWFPALVLRKAVGLGGCEQEPVDLFPPAKSGDERLGQDKHTPTNMALDRGSLEEENDLPGAL